MSKSINRNPGFNLNISDMNKGLIEPSRDLMLTHQNRAILTTSCDLLVVGQVLGIPSKSRGTIWTFVEMFAPPVSDLQAVYLASLFFDIRDAEEWIPHQVVCSTWANENLNTRFLQGFSVLETEFQKHGYQVPQSLLTLNESCLYVSARFDEQIELFGALLFQLENVPTEDYD